MSESYVELLIKRKPPIGAVIAKALIIGIIGASVLLTLLGNMITFFVAAAFCGIYYLFRGKVDLEYEYLFVGGELSVDKIIAKDKRKAVINMPIEKIDMVAPTGSEHLQEYKNKELKKLDFTSKTGKPSYTVIFNGKEIQYLILMELNQEILSMMYNVAPRKIFMENAKICRNL